MPILGDVQNVLGRLAGGPQDPRLSQQANQQAQQQGLINAGLGTIAASGPGGQTPFQAVATGLLGGQQAAQQAQESAFRNQAQEQMAQVLQQSGGQATTDAMRQMLAQAVTTGDVQTAAAISNVLPSMLRAEQPAGPRSTRTERVTVDGELRRQIVDASTGETIRDLGPAEDNRVMLRETSVNGVPGVYAIDPMTGAPTARVGDIIGGEGGPTSQERMNNRLLSAAQGTRDSFVDEAGIYGEPGEVRPGLDDIEMSLTTAGGLGAELAQNKTIFGAAANFLTGRYAPEAQLAGTLGLEWLSPMVRILSGAQMNEQEAGRYSAAFLGRFGDTEATVRRKQRGRDQLEAAVASGNGPETEEEYADFLALHGLQPLSPEEYEELQQEGIAPGGGGGRVPQSGQGQGQGQGGVGDLGFEQFVPGGG